MIFYIENGSNDNELENCFACSVELEMDTNHDASQHADLPSHKYSVVIATLIHEYTVLIFISFELFHIYKYKHANGVFENRTQKRYKR